MASGRRSISLRRWGRLEYFLAAFSNFLFPQAQPVLMTQWIWLPVTVPVMALILWDVAGRQRRTGGVLAARAVDAVYGAALQCGGFLSLSGHRRLRDLQPARGAPDLPGGGNGAVRARAGAADGAAERAAFGAGVLQDHRVSCCRADPAVWPRARAHPAVDGGHNGARLCGCDRCCGTDDRACRALCPGHHRAGLAEHRCAVAALPDSGHRCTSTCSGPAGCLRSCS
jgi:hypothetical protein